MSKEEKPTIGGLKATSFLDAARSRFAARSIGAAIILAALVCTSCQRFERVKYAIESRSQYVDPGHPLPSIEQWIEPSHIPLAIARKGISIDEVFAPGIVPAPSALRVTKDSECFELVGLRELDGLVHISSATEALGFVQLRTSSAYEYCWVKTILDITKHKQSTKAEDDSKAAEHDEATPSGMNAVLSPQAWRAGGFESPIVQRAGKNYEIVRWVCVFHGLDGKRVQKWQETVSPEGDYTLKVLVDQPAPKLPSTVWCIPGRR